MKNKLYVVLGPTSSGKTSLALDLCRDFGGEIISADSRQIYKYMDIGTGKMPVNAMARIEKNAEKWVANGINIWGYDLATPDEYFSAYDFAKFALKRQVHLYETSKNVFLVGGTGFYIDVVTGRKKPAGIKPDEELRKSLETTPTQNLVEWLTSLNMEVANRVDKKNRVRVIRALEIELKKEKANASPLLYPQDIDVIYVGLTSSRKNLYSRVDTWLDAIWEGGLLEETEKLLDMGYRRTKPLSGLIYKSTISYIDGQMSELDAKQRIKFDLHAYIRRQQTWFKKMPNVNWFDIQDENFSDKIRNLL